MTLTDLRDGLRALLPNTTIDIAGHRLLVTFAEPIHVIGIAVREDFSDYELGAADVRRPSRTHGRTPATPGHVAKGLQRKVCLRLDNLRREARHGSLWQKNAYAQALDIIAASDFATLAIAHLNTEVQEIAYRRQALDAETARKVAELDEQAEAAAARRRALVMLAPGYDGPVLAAVGSYTDDEPLIDEDGEA